MPPIFNVPPAAFSVPSAAASVAASVVASVAASDEPAASLLLPQPVSIDADNAATIKRLTNFFIFIIFPPSSAAIVYHYVQKATLSIQKGFSLRKEALFLLPQKHNMAFYNSCQRKTGRYNFSS